MPSILISLLTGFFGSVLLYLVFKLLKSDWPNNYSDMKNVMDAASRRNVWIYIAMRIIPMYVVSLLVASLSNSIGGKVSVSLITCAILHVCFTNLRPHILRRTFEPSRVRLRYIAISLSTILSITLATIIAAMTWSRLRPLLPKPDEIVQAVWTSLFVGLVVGLVRSYGVYDNNLEKQIERAQKDLGKELQQVIQKESRRNDVAVEFIQAVVLTECIQRPKWIRKIETFKGKFSGPGTYGVAQVPTDTPITDEESIKLLCQNHKGYYPAGSTNSYSRYNRTLLSARLETINSNPIFVEQAIEIINHLAPYPRERSEYYAKDGKKFIEILSLKREGTEWILTVSLGPGWQSLEMRTVTRDLEAAPSNVLIDSDLSCRRVVELKLPIGVSWVELQTVGETLPGSLPDALEMDLEDPYVDSSGGG